MKKVIPLHLAYYRHQLYELEGFQIRAFFPVFAEIGEDDMIIGPVKYSYEAEGIRLTEDEWEEILFAPFNMLAPSLEMAALLTKASNDPEDAIEQMYRLAALRRNKRVMRGHNLLVEYRNGTRALQPFTLETDAHITLDTIIAAIADDEPMLPLNQHGDFLSVSDDGVRFHHARTMTKTGPIHPDTLLDVLCADRSVTLIGVTPTHHIELAETFSPPARLTITEPPPVRPLS